MEENRNVGTKAALVRAAERLFAEKGLGGVSVRDITRAAGARNESALHYHFGGMESLIREVFANRYRAIEQSRLLRLAKIDGSKHGVDLVVLMEAAVGPLFEACQEEDGRLYSRFCVQLATDPRFNLVELVREVAMESVIALGQRLRTCLLHLPEDVLAVRLRRLFTLSLVLTADYAREIDAGTAPPLATAIGEAAASLAGFLKAPSSSNAP